MPRLSPALLAARACLWSLVAMGCASHLGAPRERAAKEGAAPACAPGTLLFSASQAPRAVALSRDATVVAVADRGGLVLRDAATLAPIRYLLPALDHWQEVAFSPDGRTLRARTLDGLGFRIDLPSGKAERLLNDEHPSNETFGDDELGFSRRFLGRAPAMEEDQRAFWKHPTPALRLPPLPAGVEVTTVAIAALTPAPGGGRLESLTTLEPPGDGENARFYVASSDGRIRAFDMADKPLAEGTLPAGTHAVYVGIGGGHVLVALNDGSAAIYDRSLVLERQVRVLADPHAPPPRGPAGLTDLIVRIRENRPLNVPYAWEAQALDSLDYDPVRRRLVWVSTSHALGVFDVASGRTLAEVPGTATVGGVDQMAFLGARTVAAVAAGRVWVWDPYDGRRTDRAGEYAAFTRLGPARLLAAQADGAADVLELDGARFRLEVRRTVCLLADGDCGGRLREERYQGRPTRPPQLELATSPDGRELAVLESPALGTDSYQYRLAVLSAETFARLRSFTIEQCNDDSPLRFGARDIAACGTRHDRATLAALPDEPASSGGPWSKPGTFDAVGPDGRWIAMGPGAIGIARMGGGYEEIFVANAQGNLTGVLASPASRTGARVNDRQQWRRASMVEPSPDGSRFLIASRGLDGPLQLWCTPTTEGIEGYPAEPPRPDVLEVDNITELAVAGFPSSVDDVVEMPDGLLLILGRAPLAADAPSFTPGEPGLWSYDPGARKVARLELPASATSGQPEVWERFDTDPGGTSIWLVGKHHLARREATGDWATFALPDATTNQLAVIGEKLAVHVGTRICKDAKPCSRGGVPFCFDVTLLGAVPASAGGPTRTFDSCLGALAPIPGGFVALSGVEMGFRDGAWVGARDPLVAVAARAHASDGFARGDELVLHVEPTRLDVLGLADGRTRRTIVLPFAGRASPVAAAPGHPSSIWLVPPGGEGAMVDLDASGQATVYGRGPAPVWAYAERLRPHGGRRALWWSGSEPLMGFDTKHWSAVFNPVERARMLALRRVGY